MEFNSPDKNKNSTDDAFDNLQSDDFKLDFATFVLSLSSTVLIATGELPDPISKETRKNIPLAKQMIDVISMLREKTKGNLTKEENELINGLCSELKMKYLQAVNFK